MTGPSPASKRKGIPITSSGRSRSAKMMAASTPSFSAAVMVTSAAIAGVLQISRMECFLRTVRYSAMYRPAWRISQIGVTSTGSQRQARTNLELGADIVLLNLPWSNNQRNQPLYHRGHRGAQRKRLLKSLANYTHSKFIRIDRTTIAAAPDLHLDRTAQTVLVLSLCSSVSSVVKLPVFLSAMVRLTLHEKADYFGLEQRQRQRLGLACSASTKPVRDRRPHDHVERRV